MLPEFRGSLFRGLLGWGLKAQICPLPLETTCESCHLRTDCEYPALFEPALAADARQDHRDFSPPFVVRVRNEPRTLLAAGDTVTFEVFLFGRAALRLQLFAGAIPAASERGLVLGHSGCTFTVAAVEVATAVDTWALLNGGSAPALASVAIPVARLVRPEPRGDIAALAVQFETPVRLKRQNRVTGWPEFGLLVDRLADRAERLLALYHGYEWGVLRREFCADAHAVGVVDGRLERMAVRRFSNRQRTTIDLPGMVGVAVYEGAVRQYLPLLRLGEFIHVGKNASAGFGRFRVIA